jgi:Transposase, Mutator family
MAQRTIERRSESTNASLPQGRERLARRVCLQIGFGIAAACLESLNFVERMGSKSQFWAYPLAILRFCKHALVDCIRMVHWFRNAFALMPKSAVQIVAATICTVFIRADASATHEQWRKVADTFRERYPRRAQLMDESETDILAYLSFPTGTGGRYGAIIH